MLSLPRGTGLTVCSSPSHRGAATTCIRTAANRAGVLTATHKSPLILLVPCRVAASASLRHLTSVFPHVLSFVSVTYDLFALAGLSDTQTPSHPRGVGTPHPI